MRSDFLGLFQRHPALQGVDFESLSLGPMRIDGMRRVIEMPARLAAIEIEDGLVDRLLADTETPDALPLLSFTLWVMCRDRRDDGRLEVAAYERLGGLQGTITREADAVLAAARRDRKQDDLRTGAAPDGAAERGRQLRQAAGRLGQPGRPAGRSPPVEARRSARAGLAHGRRPARDRSGARSAVSRLGAAQGLARERARRAAAETADRARRRRRGATTAARRMRSGAADDSFRPAT